MSARDSELWEAFLDVRYQLICAWMAQGREPAEIARTLSMDPVQVELIAGHVELGEELVRRVKWLERELARAKQTVN